MSITLREWLSTACFYSLFTKIKILAKCISLELFIVHRRYSITHFSRHISKPIHFRKCFGSKSLPQSNHYAEKITEDLNKWRRLDACADITHMSFDFLEGQCFEFHKGDDKLFYILKWKSVTANTTTRARQGVFKSSYQTERFAN